MDIEILEDTVNIRITPRFDFSVSEEFRKAYEDNESSSYTLDFKNTEYMDSSGLGMLINMKRSVGVSVIRLANCKTQIKKVLIISRFDEHFHIL